MNTCKINFKIYNNYIHHIPDKLGLESVVSCR